MEVKNSRPAKITPKKVASHKRRDLNDMLGVLDGTLTEVLNDAVDTRKANTIVALTRGWMQGVNLAVRASRNNALPTQVRGALGLPMLEAPTTKS